MHVAQALNMRSLRGHARVVSALFVSFASPAAQAQFLVAAPPDTPDAVEHAELSYAIGEARSISWLSLRLQGSPVALVTALPANARANEATAAWSAALEDSASPRIEAPAAGPACARTSGVLRAAWPRGPAIPASELELDSRGDVESVLSAQGLVLESSLPEAARYLVWSWPASQAPVTTRALRVETDAGPLSLLPGSSFPVSLNVVANGPLRYSGERDKQELGVTFVGGDRPRSDYLERLREFVADSPLLEARAQSLVFDWSIYPGAVVISPLVKNYAWQAGRDLPELDVEACVEQLRALRDSASASVSACGAAVDLQLALAVVEAERATLHRVALSSRDGAWPELLQGGGEASAPLLQAARFDASLCKVEPPATTDGRRPGGASAGEAPVRSPDADAAGEVVLEQRDVEVSCGSSTEPPDYSADEADEGCSSDGSRSSGQDADCSSGSSSTQGEADTDCSSDSASGSSSSDDGCSGDSSGGDESGYDGETCTGQAAPRADRSERSARGRRARRLETSLWSTALVGVVLPIRRRKRRAASAG